MSAVGAGAADADVLSAATRSPLRRASGRTVALAGVWSVLVAAAAPLHAEPGQSALPARPPQTADASGIVGQNDTTSGARALARGGVTGLPLPRFASLKSDPVNLRKGPGTQYPLSWVYRRAGLPIEIVQEFEGWRQVRDSEGATGWVLNALLSGRRTALVQPWVGSEAEKAKGPAAMVALRVSARRSSDIVAQVEPGAVIGIKSCDGTWCDIAIATYRGYIEQRRLWGVYPGERVR